MPPEKPLNAGSEKVRCATKDPLFSNSKTLSWLIRRLLVLIKTRMFPEPASVVTVGKISRLEGVILRSDASIDFCLESKTENAPEIASDVVCSSTQPEDTPSPNSSLARNARLLDAAS